ncbi:MAG: HDIG domain-containing protein [Bacteroidales bacterium]|nr:HDIG domain-containing protein [Bacteroidales bacterium]
MNYLSRTIINFLKSKYRYINKGFLFILSLLIVLWVIPKETKFKYDYHIGKPWLHEELIAPFDFPVYKAESDLEKEKEAALSGFIPFFRYDEAITKGLNDEFLLTFERLWTQEKSSLPETEKIKSLQFSQQIFNNVLIKGIINISDVRRITDSPKIYLLSGTTAKLVDVDSLYSINKANEKIISDLNASREYDGRFLSEIIQNVIGYTVFYDEHSSEKNKTELLESISPTRGFVQNGEKIISRGELITDEKFQLLESFKKEYKESLGTADRYYLTILGQVMILSVLIIVVFLFIYNFRKKIYENNKKLFFIILQLVFTVLITKLIVGYDISLLYAVPVCITPIIVRAFFDTRLAIFIHVITVLIISSFAPNSYQFIIYHLIAGIVAVLSIVSLTKRAKLFYTTIYIFITYMAFYIGFLLVYDGSLKNLETSLIIQFGISSVLNLLAFPMIFMFEKLFGYATDFSLLELSNSNNPLLRELASKAPGTFQHSMQVAILAEEAAYRTDANALLVRAGALYHDIGKMYAPHYFTENQVKGINPHDELSFEESAGIIINHVIKGIEMAKKYNIPEYLIDFIRTHHGTKKTDFFYRMQMNEKQGETVASKFTYKGPLPFSKETAILMMADGVEAASRSLQAYDDENIDKMVDGIIDGQIADNQFYKSELTYKDTTLIRQVFKNKLKNIYHVRIAYPQLNKSV